MIHSTEFKEALNMLRAERWSPELERKVKVLVQHVSLEERRELLLLLDKFSRNWEDTTSA